MGCEHAFCPISGGILSETLSSPREIRKSLFSLAGLLITNIPFEISIAGTEFNKINLVVPLLYAIALAGLYISLVSVSYYSKRILLTKEPSIILELLKERFGTNPPRTITNQQTHQVRPVELTPDNEDEQDQQDSPTQGT